jgi:hypothetical protein
VPDGKADDPRRAGRTRQHGRLQQSLEIDGGVVPHLTHAARGIRPSEDGGTFEDERAIDGGHEIDDGAIAGIDEPVDPCLWKRGAQGGGRGDRMDDVPERTQPHDQDIHPRIRASRSRVECPLGSPTMAMRPP